MNNFKPFPRYLEVGFYCDTFRMFYNINKPRPNFKYVFLLRDDLDLNILQSLPRLTFNQLLNNHKSITEQDQFSIILNKRYEQ